MNGTPLGLRDPDMDALPFSETTAIKYQSTRHKNPKDLDLQNRSENLKSRKVVNILNGKITCRACKNNLLLLLQFG
jgi:hypothetical protein